VFYHVEVVDSMKMIRNYIGLRVTATVVLLGRLHDATDQGTSYHRKSVYTLV
jgi:hypothetical protein